MSEVSPERIELTRPDDWHLHLRDGAQMASVLPHTTARFARAIVMPNLRPPVVSTEMAREYRDRILEALPPGSDFEPLMTLYLTDNTPSAEIGRALESGFVHGLKLYPAGATTNSDDGVTDLGKLDHVFEAMAEAGLPLLVHGEVTEARVDIFDRERVFIEEVLAPLVERHPQLKIVFEHVTTAEAVDFVADARDGVAATITAHHLLMDRNDMLAGGMRPHHYCLPVLKRQRHRRRLLEAAASGSPRFFLGTDSAPHPRGAKLSGCGCAGIYTAHAALELYAEAFEEVDALDRLEGFASHHGADFYGLPRNRATLSLVREPWDVPSFYDFGEGRLVPLRAGERIRWRMEPAAGDGSRDG